MRKVAAFSILLALLSIVLWRSASAASFSGMAIDATVYSIVVKSDDGNVKIFQIRPTTKGPRDIHPQDRVSVSYVDENGVLVATAISIAKRYSP